ncbi:MAG: GH92 family glycosyl hydrolase, partial [Saprospiraceae bacterium]
MKKICLLAGLCAAVALGAQNDPLRYVNPFVGTGGHGHTFPGAAAPWGMAQVSPDTRIDMLDWDACSGYHYSDTLLYGFSHTHLSGTGVADYGDILLLPYVGKTETDPRRYVTPIDKKTERAEAGYYAVRLRRHRILAELTATPRVGVHRYTFPANREIAKLLIDLRHRDETLEASMALNGDREVVGHRVSRAWAKEQHIFFVIRFSRPFQSGLVLDMSKSPAESARYANGRELTALFEFYHQGEPLVVKVGLSAISIEGAYRNLESEAPHFDFERYKQEAQKQWREALSAIQVEGGSDAQKTVFYTALYHNYLHPNLWSDIDGRYRGRNNRFYEAGKGDVYTVFSLWDTYRATKPLYALLQPRRLADFARSMLAQVEHGGYLPVWELSANETDCMIGNHAIPVLTDAWRKGVRDFDGRKALDAMLKSANSDRYGLQHYRIHGYIPAEMESESVSKTLEYAYDDWCIAEMAAMLGQEDVAADFRLRAQYYRNLYDPETRFFRAKNNGLWHEPWDPYEVNFNYTEANAWQYRFAAQHDVDGMIALHGGPEAFEQALDELFSADTRTTGREQSDISGLIGQYAHGNEPSHHLAYLYNYAGRPDKTQRRVRQIMDEMYADRPDGLIGNEDCGQMSAWYVFSALGFYPVTPGSDTYVIGTPLFDKAELRLPNGKTFRVTAPGASAKRPYIRSATLDGKPYARSWLAHETLLAGGDLALEMSETPTDWGAAPACRPSAAVSGPALTLTPFVREGRRSFRDRQQIALASAQSDASIYYTLDDTEPTERAMCYSGPFTLAQSAVLRAVAVREGRPSRELRASFSRREVNLPTPQYLTRFSNQYAGGGEEALVDGLRGGPDFRNGEWQGFQGVDMDVILDLGSEKSIRALRVGFLQDENSWIFFPESLRVQCAGADGRYRELGLRANTVDPLEKGALIRDFEAQAQGAGASVRYLRITAKNRGICPPGHKGAGLPSWIFADEVMVEFG